MRQALLFLALLLTLASPAEAIETLAFDVIEDQGDIQIRRYAPHLLATVTVAGDFDAAGSQAFRPLFDFISGANAGEEKIAMTAPVLQQASGPQSPDQTHGWAISFVMPDRHSAQTLPAPRSAEIRISQQPGGLMAAVTYRGGWGRAKYLENEQRLLNGLQSSTLVICGTPRWARYDPPFMPWFLRKNEILIPLCSANE